MPGWNGSGGFTRARNWVADKAAGPPTNKVTASLMDEDADNFVTGLEHCQTVNGETTITANLPMATFRHTGVGNAVARTDYASAAQVQDGAIVYGGTSTGTDTVAITLAPAITAYAAGQQFTFKLGGTNTTAVTLNVNAVGAKAVQKNGAALVAGDWTTGDIVSVEYDGTQFQMLSPARTPVLTAGGVSGASLAAGTVALAKLDQDDMASLTEVVVLAGDSFILGDASDSGNLKRDTIQGILDLITVGLPRSYLAGLTMAQAADTDHDITIAVGKARDSTDAVDLSLASAITKRIDAAWAVGTNQGGLDGTESVAGTPDANTWYHVWLIKRSDTGVVDALFSESATAPTMPTNYDYKRRLGAVRTDGSANIRAFTQHGDNFWYASWVSDLVNGTIATAGTTLTLTVPTGLRVTAMFNASVGTFSRTIGFYPGDFTGATMGNTTVPVGIAGGGNEGQGMVLCMTNTSAQVKGFGDSGGTTDASISTLGWIDTRGRDD